MTKFSKPWLSLAEQINLLKQRGLIIDDMTKAEKALSRIGYYRISGYLYPFRAINNGKKIDAFKNGTHFQHAIDLYIFDKKLRWQLLDALERIEIALRVDIAHTLGKKDPFAYLNPDCLDAKFCHELDKKGTSKHHQWLSKHAQIINRSKEDFVLHNKKKYGFPLAIWIACETWDFGTLSTLYAGMRSQEQDQIAQKYGIKNGRFFASWLRSLNYLRNICSHHARLWNRNIIEQPRIPTDVTTEWFIPYLENDKLKARCFILLFITRHLMKTLHPHSAWFKKMQQHLSNFPKLNEQLDINLADMGAPPNWSDLW